MGEMQKIEVKLSDSVKVVKTKIGKGTPLNKMSLVYGNQTMLESKSLSFYGIKIGSIVTCQLKTLAILFIKKHTGKSIMVKVSLSDTVFEIKEAIKKAEGTQPLQQVLRFSGQTLKDDKKISEYGIKNGYTVQLIIALPMSISNPKVFDPKHNLDFTNLNDGSFHERWTCLQATLWMEQVCFKC